MAIKKEKVDLTVEKFKEDSVLSKLDEFWKLGQQYYARDFKKMRLLDATDKGDLWRALGAKFPVYQILTDTNWVSYVKSNLLASLYTVSKSADIVHTDEKDVGICMELSALMNHLWDVQRIGFTQFQAGERAALCNLGVTQVGYDQDLPGFDIDKTETGNVALKNIDPMKYMRDPFADSLENAAWVCTYDTYHKSVFLSNKLYREKFRNFMQANGTANTALPSLNDRPATASSKDHYNLIIWWYRKDDGKIREVHTLDNKFILHEKDEINPNEYPFAELYCNLPGTGLVGVSEPAKVFADNMAFNLMQSIQLTAEYKNQRPPKFVSSASGLNIAAFTKHGDDADRAFIVNGDASKAVHYHQFPFPSPTLPTAMQSLMYNIKDASGVDDRYTGRDTGSITTTGGTQKMLDQVTMIDAPKIILYEEYTARLTKLIVKNLICHAPTRTYYLKDTNTTLTGPAMQPKYKKVVIPFPDIDDDILFNYAIQISSEMPKNKARVAAWANMMMEKQMQYRDQGNNVELITEEEWLQMQDVPYKEQMLKRMGVQREIDSFQETTQVINEYASMLDSGMGPSDAMAMAAEGLTAMRQGQPSPFQQAQESGEAMPMGQMLPTMPQI